ncbi:MAG: GNAT family N-acetyltransferase [Thermoplasmata archaeon]|nr:GNAT family N-acetyltransferase [Thermoplasmata archaeon]
MTISEAKIENVERILFVINESNRKYYKSIVPPEHYREPVLTYDELLRIFETMTFFTYKEEDEIVGVAALEHLVQLVENPSVFRLGMNRPATNKYTAVCPSTNHQMDAEFKSLRVWAYGLLNVNFQDRISTPGHLWPGSLQGERADLHWVYILPDNQKKGIGSSLVKHIEVEAKRRRIRILRVPTAEKAFWARSFYLKLGYEITGREERPEGYLTIFEKEICSIL